MLRLGLLLLILPGVVLMAVFWAELSDVNACLSAGGSFNYGAAVCDMNNSHSFVPFAARHPLFVNLTMLASAAGFFCCLFGLYVRGR
ncbi:hypothetical protein EH243_12010 [Amphritea opalescens]|uniref:Uncharacterized protein n=1 Tax=Amphritea opalescens TaxID=2490544 RepID=A0A430KPG4_9GAMM|nr:hypothetical protein [Amphritea opalescens]RTE65388.1 hypothetical protein EH243_12010 [Amphritea opalescens]